MPTNVLVSREQGLQSEGSPLFAQSVPTESSIDEPLWHGAKLV